MHFFGKHINDVANENKSYYANKHSEVFLQVPESVPNSGIHALSRDDADNDEDDDDDYLNIDLSEHGEDEEDLTDETAYKFCPENPETRQSHRLFNNKDPLPPIEDFRSDASRSSTGQRQNSCYKLFSYENDSKGHTLQTESPRHDRSRRGSVYDQRRGSFGEVSIVISDADKDQGSKFRAPSRVSVSEADEDQGSSSRPRSSLSEQEILVRDEKIVREALVSNFRKFDFGTILRSAMLRKSGKIGCYAQKSETRLDRLARPTGRVYYRRDIIRDLKNAVEVIQYLHKSMMWLACFNQDKRSTSKCEQTFILHYATAGLCVKVKAKNYSLICVKLMVLKNQLLLSEKHLCALTLTLWKLYKIYFN